MAVAGLVLSCWSCEQVDIGEVNERVRSVVFLRGSSGLWVECGSEGK